MTIDYAVRFFTRDVVPSHPDAALIMFGLNDQRATVSPVAYLEQYRWLADHFVADCHADPVFLQPTPHWAIPVTPAERKPDSNPPWYAFRTIEFAERLRPLGEEMKVPVVDTFSALWGRGAPTLEESCKDVWPFYPLSLDQQMTSMVESSGIGDPVHPNALGQLQIARAVYRTLTGTDSRSTPIILSGTTEWTKDGVVSHITARNDSDRRREGALMAYPLLDAEVRMVGSGAYNLAAGQETRFDVLWPHLKTGQDLLDYPYNLYVAPGDPLIPVVDFSSRRSHVYGVDAPFGPDEPRLVRERLVSDTGNLEVGLLQDGKRTDVPVAIPAHSQVGRIPLVQKVILPDCTGWAAAELAYTQFGLAKPGEAKVDGDLDEWDDQEWVPVGEECQARSIRGVEDNRADIHECTLEWAFKAGKNGMYLAAKAQGQVQKDNFILYFDPRSPDQLGTAGPYFWVTGSLNADGTLKLAPGETSGDVTGLAGAWKPSADGANLEIFVPYSVMNADSWPDSGDLGHSIVWNHTGPNGKLTTLMWAEDGFPWNPLWYGVVRLDRGKPAPYRIKVK